MNQLTNIFKILSDENRLRMLVLLYQEELCVCELSGILGIPQPRISQNLSKLRDLNLVDDERKEKFVFYTLKWDNKILTDALKNIIDNMEHYPKLIVDKKRLNDKEMYLNQCCPNQ
ncbi:ArsR/SmtB family transcription factor [Parasporobacterium paucivorans]|uniref:Transcriptional regulator, ArsR family n=1 Tax=Parasporobacterium paucivorans DSM 15970 TaxID=1122934 RepID=A0A1M6ELY4_9FIRM|nr:metalloregulator ArsR/SmtB family transcription factor [Parasporobacterium paucivorans]SHI86517.1 transcriptional regulator, ArsR family [Parasporobacterium paucivorans DSM 15970]